MRSLFLFAALFFGVIVLAPALAGAQVDDVSDATGMPIPIGAPVIYGQVELRGLKADDRRPTIFVTLLDGGAQIDRRQTNSRGYYYFLKRPRNGQTLLFEVDGKEVGRVVVSAGISGRLRQDIMLDWQAISGADRSTTGVISAKDRYDRSPAAEKQFDKAMAAVREQKNAEAIVLFNAIVSADPKDHFAWTMLGTLYANDKKYPDATNAFNKALEAKPDFTLALVNFGRMELSRKEYPRSIDLLTKAVELEPASAEANHVLGEAYLQSKKGSMAVVFLNKAIELAPVEKADIHLRLAALYNAAGLKDRAVAEYQAFLGKVKDHPEEKAMKKYIADNTPK